MVSARIDAAKSAVDKYASMVLHYTHNAEKYLKSKDYYVLYGNHVA